ncbi:MAG: flagellar protein FlgN [Gammaproteobacteria bacterium]|nr:flagellar protein FlgN [Gammaproteobacteria bacterium]NNF61190.1 flagellar protein FlgN [Gammaproteobacteria bacterium]NNM19939.1 flagellar protein FlgN [Gammaproteobacteria bacterium]
MNQQWHKSLRDIIGHELALAKQLGDALAGEREALRAVDPAALDAATARKHDCIEGLSALDGERRQLCATAGVTTDRSGMEHLLLQADPAGALTDSWNQLLGQLEACREANTSNGVIVRLQKRRVTEALGLLHGEAANNAVYGDTGEVDENAGTHVHAEI